MVASWTPPKTWAIDDVFEAAVANTHVRNNLEYLFSRPTDFANIVYLTTPTAISATIWTHLATFDLTLSTESGIVEYHLSLQVDGAFWTMFDVYVPELNIWLSSGSSTQNANGLSFRDNNANTIFISHNHTLIIDLGAAGDYTFELWYKAQAAGATLYNDVTHSVYVKEV